MELPLQLLFVACKALCIIGNDCEIRVTIC